MHTWLAALVFGVIIRHNSSNVLLCVKVDHLNSPFDVTPGAARLVVVPAFHRWRRHGIFRIIILSQKLRPRHHFTDEVRIDVRLRLTISRLRASGSRIGKRPFGS
jgi:hypothetical protein